MRRAPRVVSALLAVVALVSGGRVHADELNPTFDQPLSEIAHTVDVRVAAGVATYTVRRTVANAGTIDEAADLLVRIPSGASVTSLRVKNGPTWEVAALRESIEASGLYAMVPGGSEARPGTAVLLEAFTAGEVQLALFPIRAGATMTIEYTLVAPAFYGSGRWVMGYPRGSSDSTNTVAPIVRVHGGGGPIFLDRRPIVADEPATIRSDALEARFTDWSGYPVEVGAIESAATVAKSGEVMSARVKVSLRHPYRGDLSLSLRPPSGGEISLRNADGVPGSDLDATFPVALPKGARAEGTWILRIEDQSPGDAGELGRWTLSLAVKGEAAAVEAPGKPGLRVPDATLFPEGMSDAPVDRGEARIEITPPAFDTVAARLGHVALGKGEHLLRLDVEPASPLRAEPKALSVVFVIDASHSMEVEARGIDAVLAAGFAETALSARFEVVLFRRRAERLAGAFLEAHEIEKTVASARAAGKLAPGNGSALEEGLRLAAEALAGRKGAKIVVVITDGRVREHFENRHALEAFRGAAPATVLHLVVPRADDTLPYLDRDDEHPLAAIAAARGGVMWRFGGLGSPDEKARGHVARDLIRPTRIDAFRVAGFEVEPPASLFEGAGYGVLARLPKAPGAVVLAGKIGARSFAKKVPPSPAYAKVALASAFAAGLLEGLAAPETLRLARLAHVVSEVTSLVVARPGTRPLRGGRGISLDRGVGLAGDRMAGKIASPVTPPLPDLRAALLPGAKKCLDGLAGVAKESFALAVETTRHEVVDVRLERGAPGVAATCLEEAAWALALDPKTSRRERHTFVVAYP